MYIYIYIIPKNWLVDRRNHIFFWGGAGGGSASHDPHCSQRILQVGKPLGLNKLQPTFERFSHSNIPICSMYSIFTYIWVIFWAHVGKCSIHGAYRICKSKHVTTRLHALAQRLQAQQSHDLMNHRPWGYQQNVQHMPYINCSNNINKITPLSLYMYIYIYICLHIYTVYIYIYAHPCTVGIKPPISIHMAVCQNLVPLVNIKIAGKWMFIPLKMVLIGIDP